ncbi:MAG: hypothetical protein ABSA13_09945 [Beijerinckiaceae bacterium]|jgi:hypothetical protein
MVQGNLAPAGAQLLIDRTAENDNTRRLGHDAGRARKPVLENPCQKATERRKTEDHQNDHRGGGERPARADMTTPGQQQTREQAKHDEIDGLEDQTKQFGNDKEQGAHYSRNTLTSYENYSSSGGSSSSASLAGTA